MTPKQQVFVQEYLIDLNASDAAVRAGYSKKTSRWIGMQLLNKTHINAAITAAMEDRSKRTGVTQDFVLGELVKIAGFDIRKLLEPDGSVKLTKDWDDDSAAAVSSLDVAEIFAGSGDQKMAIGLSKKIGTRDKIKALELLGKHLKLFTEKVDVGATGSLEQLILASMGGKNG